MQHFSVKFGSCGASRKQYLLPCPEKLLKRQRKNLNGITKCLVGKKPLMKIGEDKSIFLVLALFQYLHISYKIAHPFGKKYISPWELRLRYKICCDIEFVL